MDRESYIRSRAFAQINKMRDPQSVMFELKRGMYKYDDPGFP